MTTFPAEKSPNDKINEAQELLLNVAALIKSEESRNMWIEHIRAMTTKLKGRVDFEAKTTGQLELGINKGA